MIMNENRTIHLIDVPIGGKSGFVWNRLHGEREDICEALLKDTGPLVDNRKDFLQIRLRKIDDALDRLMAGAYGNCSKCGGSIDDSRLDVDPALALCLDCWSREHPTGEEQTQELRSNCDLPFGNLKPFDTILLQTHNSDYRILLLDPTTGRALVEGGSYMAHPSEALVRGSAIPGSEFRGGEICVGCRVEMWVDERVFITSPVKSIEVLHPVESVETISAALH
jgi:DksA/TraR C4-type zinc finger protein